MTEHLHSSDDLVLPFEIKPLGVRGRLVRLGAVVDDILHRHDYPPAVSALLAEAVALTAMLGASLKFDGKFILQTKTDGPVDMIVADYRVARKAARLCPLRPRPSWQALDHPGQAALLGKGYLAMTVDQGADMERYQGIVPLEGEDLTAAAHGYFAKSEQIPTRLRMAAGPLLQRGTGPKAGGPAPSWCSTCRATAAQARCPAIRAMRRRAWTSSRPKTTTGSRRGCCSTRSRPTNCSTRCCRAEQLLYRLYHEDGVTAYPATALERYCSCSRESITSMLPAVSRRGPRRHGGERRDQRDLRILLDRLPRGTR